MRVLVRVEMRGTNARFEDSGDLLAQFVVRLYASASTCLEKLHDRRRVTRTADEHEMTADVERGVLTSQTHRVVKRFAGGHERGSGKDSARVSFNDACVHVPREAEVVGVDDKLSQNSLSWMVRNFFGLARKSFIS